MFNIDNIIQCTSSISSSSSHTSSSVTSYRPHLTSESPTLSEHHASSFPSPLYHPLLTPQQQQHCFYESPSQSLSQDEWALIASLRKMKNLSVSSKLEPPPSSLAHQEAVNLTYCQSSCSDQSGHQIQLSTHYATAPISIRSYAPSTTPQQLLSAQQISYPPAQLLPTAVSQPLKISASIESEQIPLSLPIPSPQPMSSPSQIQSSHQNHSPMLQQQQKPADRSTSTSPHHHQSTYPQASAIFQYNPTVTGPMVQLLDPTKPYELGDAIKIGRHILKSGALSMKYWCEDDITVSETTAGGYMLNMAGYSYFVKHYGKSFITWECEYRRKQGCSSVVIRSSDPTMNNYFRIYSMQGEHIHEPAPNNVELRRFKRRIRERCRQELSSPRTIYEDELKKGKYSSEMLAILPTFYNMQAQLYRIRKENLPSSPTDPNFILHPGFTATDRGDRFLLYDSNNVQAPYAAPSSRVGRLIIYASDLQLNILSKSKRVGSDGTFETAAQITHQNYIIMGEYEEKYSVPVAFCLCEHKNYETYQLIIQVLKAAVGTLKLDFQPMYWMSDYEAALTKAIKKELPRTKLLGCASHYNQAIYRNIQTKGLQDAYQNVEVVRQILRQIMALAFIPSDQIKKLYNDVIKPQLNNVPKRPVSLSYNLNSFLKYYESYWLTNIYKFCVFDQPTRTNNELEGYNNKMNVQLAAHPHLYRLITWFEKEELLVQQLEMKIISNVSVHKRKRALTTILIDESLQSLWASYKAGTLTPKRLLLESSKWVAKKA
ncbi:unnamed protein product [Rotaria magnacalcarata]|uniref:MULE transposase domain-containing protein n=3 Tax=Rotaria magnacalcarata TaxID=392030 RepID=A0A8S2LV19_9BILA|nr:unnamed protein product [Rotaria magnacalcarata]CAF3918138.1 unnamed protein product [Rotaria magnacalcarata]